jgi:ferredoxin-fold anticodon binding domain-containing protein
VEVNQLAQFVNKEILIVYEDSGHVCRARGVLKSLSPDSIVLETANNVLIISTRQILKIKISKEDLA